MMLQSLACFSRYKWPGCTGGHLKGLPSITGMFYSSLVIRCDTLFIKVTPAFGIILGFCSFCSLGIFSCKMFKAQLIIRVGSMNRLGSLDLLCGVRTLS